MAENTLATLDIEVGYVEVVEILDVLYNEDRTVILWSDGTVTTTRCVEGDVFDKRVGRAICIAKKYDGKIGF